MNTQMSENMNKGKDIQRSADFYLDLVCRYTTVVKKALVRHGDKTIADYVKNYTLPYCQGYQKRDDFLEITHDFLLPLVGSSLARRTASSLAKTPVVLTASHHGVDYFAQSVQGSLLFSLVLSAKDPDSSIIPILACANIPLNNLTYPRGILIYHCARQQWDRIPQKLPIFSDQAKTGVVSTTPPFDAAQIARALKRVNQMKVNGNISSQISDTLGDILEQEYAHSMLSGLNSYSEQSLVINFNIWKRLFTQSQKRQDMIYMPLEAIVVELLKKDFCDPFSLVSLLMFEPDIRTCLLNGLDGRRACWQTDLLATRNQADVLGKSIKRLSASCGTHFFWGVDEKNRLIPMALEKKGSRDLTLKGKDIKGNVYTLPFDGPSLLKALEEKVLLPSLFTCYTALSLARGITCIGGYYQSEYFPVMQKAVVKALNQTTSFEGAASHVAEVSTSKYLSGMQMVMAKADVYGLIPAGPVEIINGSGLNKKDLALIKELTFKEAHQASLFESIGDVVPYETRPAGWQKEISRNCLWQYKDKIVIKS
ncbi:MAG: hypothetical protein GY729_12200 [Desulfobacteraceae bacterium]|nr:hypothetical protein [Desulfobacteraceae bacterium]